MAKQTTTNGATVTTSKAKGAALTVPATVVNPFKQALQQLATRGTKQATAASKSVSTAANSPSVGNIAPVGVAVRNAGQAATIPGFALVGTNSRKQPLASSVTAQIWLAALAYQLANNGTMPTQAHIKLACPTVNPTSCGLGLTQYKAYTGQCKGMPVLTLVQLQAMAVAPATPAPATPATK